MRDELRFPFEETWILEHIDFNLIVFAVVT